MKLRTKIKSAQFRQKEILTQAQGRSRIPEDTSQRLGGCNELIALTLKIESNTRRFQNIKMNFKEGTSFGFQVTTLLHFPHYVCWWNQPSATVYYLISRVGYRLISTTLNSILGEKDKKNPNQTSSAVVCLLPYSDNPAPKPPVESVKCSWPDIFNMALVLNGQMNAEMRHVALANAPERPWNRDGQVRCSQASPKTLASGRANDANLSERERGRSRTECNSPRNRVFHSVNRLQRIQNKFALTLAELPTRVAASRRASSC